MVRVISTAGLGFTDYGEDPVDGHVYTDVPEHRPRRKPRQRSKQSPPPAPPAQHLQVGRNAPTGGFAWDDETHAAED